MAAVLAAADALIRPVLRRLAGRIGAIAALVLGVVVQVALVELALLVVPGRVGRPLGTPWLALVIVALVSVVTRWLVGVNDSSYLVADLVRRGRAKRRGKSGSRRRAATRRRDRRVRSTASPIRCCTTASSRACLPTLARWVRSGSHDAVRWWARVPVDDPGEPGGPAARHERRASRPSAGTTSEPGGCS